MTFNYINNVPDAPNNPSVDQPNMKINTQSIKSIISIDHQTFGTGNNEDGYHTVIHQDGLVQGTWNATARTGTPAAIPNVNQFLSLQYTPDVNGGGTPDTQLFSVTGAGGKSQLTGSNASAEGYCWTGGLLFQWGKVTLSNGSTQSGTVTFKTRAANVIPFPTACFIVIPGLVLFGAPQSSSNVSISSISANSFSWQFNTTALPHIYDFYWFAVGQ